MTADNLPPGVQRRHQQQHRLVFLNGVACCANCPAIWSKWFPSDHGRWNINRLAKRWCEPDKIAAKSP
mgnify:CR=1 FL=1